MPKRFWLTATALTGFAFGPAEAGTLYLAILNGTNEVPSNTSTATGVGVLILNDARTSATVSGTHNLAATGATVIAGHIHRGPAGVNGPVIFPFPSPASPIGPLTWAIPSADVTNLDAGGLYFNIHTVVRPGGEIRGQLQRALLAPSATSDTQRNLANALDVSAGFNADLDQVLIQTNLLNSATAKAQALDDLSARSIYVQGRHAAETMSSFDRSLLAQADDQCFGAMDKREGPTLFATAGYDFGHRSTTSHGAGSKIERPFVVAGYDYRFGDDGSIGLALGYADGKEKLRGGLGRSDIKTISVQGYFSARLGGSGLALDGAAGYGWIDLDTRRVIPSLSRTATSSHDGNAWSAVLKVSGSVDMGSDTVLAPYAAVDRQEANIDGYTETGAGAVGLVVPDLDTSRSALEAGATFAAPSQQSWGALMPRLLVAAHHAIDTGDEAFSARLSGSTVGFVAPIQRSGKTAARLEASLVAETTEGITAAFSYRGLVGAKDQSNHAVEARVRVKF